MKRRTIVLMLMSALIVGGGCGDNATDEGEAVTASSGPLTVYSVNYPLQYFAQRIGGNTVRAEFPVPGDVDPAFWSPSAEDVAAYQSADLILINGATYAKWLDKVSLPAAKLIDTSHGFRDRYIQIENVATHSHGTGGEHAHAGTAFTTWLDPVQAIEQARAVEAALAAARPERAAFFAANLAALVADLEELDRNLRAVTAGKTDRPLVASHPVYQYLARRYDLDLAPMMWEPNVMPEPGQWQDLVHLLETHPAHWMIWEGEPLPAAVVKLRALGIGSLVFEPCGNTPAAGDYLSVMRSNVAALTEAFR